MESRLSPPPGRIALLPPVRRLCLRHMDYTEELRAKAQRVQNPLTRLGGSGVEVEGGSGVQRNRCTTAKSPVPGVCRREEWALPGPDPPGNGSERPASSKSPRRTRRPALCAAIWQSTMCRGTTEKTGEGLVTAPVITCQSDGTVSHLRGGERRKAPRGGCASGGHAPGIVPEAVGIVLNSNTPARQCDSGRPLPDALGQDTLTRILSAATPSVCPSIFLSGESGGSRRRCCTQGGGYAGLTGAGWCWISTAGPGPSP